MDYIFTENYSNQNTVTTYYLFIIQNPRFSRPAIKDKISGKRVKCSIPPHALSVIPNFSLSGR